MNPKMKTAALWALGILATLAFLTVCSEPAPDNEISYMNFVLQKVVAMGVLIGSICAIGKLRYN